MTPEPVDDTAAPPVTGNRHERVEPRMTTDYEAWVTRAEREVTAEKTRATKLERERDAVVAERDAALAETATKLAEAQSAADQRVIRVAMKALAEAAGLNHASDLTLVDMAKLKLTDDGDVEGGAAALDALKKARPELFASGNTTATGPKPNADVNPKRAMDLSDADYAAEVARLKRG